MWLIEYKSQIMNKKLREALSLKCKDMGLTDKALDELAKLGSEGLADDASDDDINAKVDLLVPYAKAIQAETTRKTRKPKQKQSTEDGEGEDENGNGDKDVPEWFKKQMKGYDKKLKELQDENNALKAEKEKTARQAEIAEKAKKLGIPDYLMKRVSFADDADLDKELSDYKQELVTNNLMPKEQAHEQGKTDEAMKASAKAWAESLPDK